MLISFPAVVPWVESSPQAASATAATRRIARIRNILPLVAPFRLTIPRAACWCYHGSVEPKRSRRSTVLSLLFNPLAPAILLTRLAVDLVTAGLERLRPRPPE